MPRSHCFVFVQKRRKNIRFCETVHTTPHKNAQKRRFSKRSSKWIFTKTEDFENPVDQCERTKTDKNKTLQQQQHNTIFSPYSTLNLKKAKTYEMESAVAATGGPGGGLGPPLFAKMKFLEPLLFYFGQI